MTRVLKVLPAELVVSTVDTTVTTLGGAVMAAVLVTLAVFVPPELLSVAEVPSDVWVGGGEFESESEVVSLALVSVADVGASEDGASVSDVGSAVAEVSSVVDVGASEDVASSVLEGSSEVEVEVAEEDSLVVEVGSADDEGAAEEVGAAEEEDPVDATEFASSS